MYAGVPSATPDGGELVSARGFGHRLGHAEIHDQRVAARQQHVLGLDVAVDHAGAVGRGERLGDLAQQPHGLGYRKLADAREPVAQRLALYERHHVVEEAAGLTGVEHTEDVRVLQAGGDLDLPREPLGAEGGGELRAQHLQRHFAVVLQVLGEVDSGHAALSELPLDAVALGQGSLQSGYRLGHRGLLSRDGGRWPECYGPASGSLVP